MSSKQPLRDRWASLEKLEGVTAAQRGFALESLLLELALADGIPGSPSFRTPGEQVDGLLELDNRYLLLECKWVADPVAASEIYAFRAKVEGKLVGTVGVFVAIHGFAEFVPDVLRYGKGINIVLFDGGDVRLALADEHSLKDVLRAKLRRAAPHGEVYYTYQRVLDERSG